MEGSEILRQEEQELLKSIGEEDDVFDQLNKMGAAKLRGDVIDNSNEDVSKSRKSKTSSKSEEDEDEEEEEDGEFGKSMFVEAEYADASDVMGAIFKNADGNLVELYDGAEVLAKAIDGFAQVVEDSNKEIATNNVIIKSLYQNQLMIAKAMVQQRQESNELMKALADVLETLPTNQPQRGALMDFRSKLRINKTNHEEEGQTSNLHALDKNISSTNESHPQDAFLGMSPDRLFSVVNKALQDPEISAQFKLLPDHLACKRRGISVLPKKFVNEYLLNDAIEK